MSEQVEAPDLTDKYQAHAYWALAFICDCGAAIDPSTNHRQFSKAYFEQMAQDAKDAGWTLPDLDDREWFPKMICWCPSCSESQT